MAAIPAHASYKSNTSQTHNLLERGTEYLRDNAGRIRLTDFFLFFLLIFGSYIPGTTIYFTIPVLGCIALLAFMRKPVYNVGEYKKIFVLLALFMVYLVIVSMIQPHSAEAFDWTRRVMRMAFTTLIIYFVADGRIHIRSAILGYSAALFVNVFAWFAGVGADNYTGFLTGFIGDKNGSGMAYAIFGILILLAVRNRYETIAAIVFSYWALWLTGSRTSLGAYTAAVLWILIAPKLNIWLRIAYGFLTYFVLNILTQDYAQTGAFADRTGTDILRSRIDEASLEKAADTGFFGRGLGEAVTTFAGDTHRWVFHNSYVGAFVEGGWPWLIVLIGITVFVIVGILRPKGQLSRTEVIIQAAGISLAVCSWRLGEVLYTWQWCLVLGIAIRALIISRDIHLAGKDIKGKDIDLDADIEVKTATRSVREAKNANV